MTDLTKEDADFLKEYIEKEEWRIDKYGGDDDLLEDIGFEEDEAFLERNERFESDYRFRFQEPGSQDLIGQSRSADGSMRKKESKRKRQRVAKAERKAKLKKEEDESIKRQKNAKRREIQERMSEIKEASGAAIDADLLEKLLDSDNEFDVETWDAKMGEAFNDDYYQDEDDEYKAPISSTDRKGRSTKDSVETAGRTMDAKEQLAGLVREYYDLDREDTIDGVKCRYKYVKVPKEDYGLKVEDILCLDDKQLNEYVGMRQLNPYREDIYTYKYNRRKLKKLFSQVDYANAKLPKAPDPKQPIQMDDQEKNLAAKINETSDSNVKSRLESYSHSTLLPYTVQKSRTRKMEADNSTISYEGMTKSQKKNAKRRKTKRESKGVSMPH